MDGIDRLDFPTLVEHFDQKLTVFIVIYGDKCFTLLSDKFQKTIIFRISQYRNVVDFRAIKALILIQKAIDDDLILALVIIP